MDHETLDDIKRASTERRICKLFFKNEPRARVIYPYGIFRTAKGKFMIACWQEGGYSTSGKLPEFRNFPVEKCEKIELLDRKFLMAEQFDPTASIYHEWVYHI
jgi:hypothetical protein